MARILIVDDSPDYGAWLAMLCEREELEAEHIMTLEEGLRRAEEWVPDVVILDVVFPEGNGIEFLPRFRAVPSAPEVIIMTGKADMRGAELAIQCGAWDYIAKGASKEDVRLIIARALAYREQKLAARAAPPFDRGRIVGGSAALHQCLELAAQAARYDTNILVTGETGTGKELLARAIHDNSPRKGGPFVIVDCASLPESLVESMLFGHEKGAFTGADHQSNGLIAQANGGTLLLDEVGEMPLATQRRFLRVLQERRFRRVGGKEELTSDFRLVATTNRDLDQLTGEGQFRLDLLHRLRTMHIYLPPLRERLEDLDTLTTHLLHRICDRFRIQPKICAPETVEAFIEYQWPGNIRELNHVLEHAVTQCEGRVLYGVHLPTQLRCQLMRSAFSQNESPTPAPSSIPSPSPIPDTATFSEYRNTAVSAAEAFYLRGLMERTGNDIQEACRAADLSRARLYALLKQYDISRKK